MAPRRGSQNRQRSPTPDPDGMFQGMVVFLVPKGVQPRRLQVWIPPPLSSSLRSFPALFCFLVLENRAMAHLWFGILERRARWSSLRSIQDFKAPYPLSWLRWIELKAIFLEQSFERSQTANRRVLIPFEASSVGCWRGSCWIGYSLLINHEVLALLCFSINHKHFTIGWTKDLFRPTWLRWIELKALS